MSTAASRSRGSFGITCVSAAGPPVEDAIHTTCRTALSIAKPREAIGLAETNRRDRASTFTPRKFVHDAARSASSNSSRTRPRSRLIGPEGLRTKSTAPNSRARSVASAPPSAPPALSITTGRGNSLMMYPSASSPSRPGISMSRVTMSGLSACTLRSASAPSRAVPITVNSPLDATTSLTMRRMNALSSTTSTRRTGDLLESDIALGQ